MHRRFTLLAAVLALIILGSVIPAAAQANKTTRRAAASESDRPTEILVKYRNSRSAAAIRKRVGGRLIASIPGQAVEIIKPEGPLDQAIAAIQADANVAYAEPNYLYKASSVTPNDPRFGQLWGLDKIRMPEAWQATRGSKDVTVAVVDSGMALTHPDLASNVWTNPGEAGQGRESNGIDDDGNGYVDDWRGWDWIDADNRPGDAHGHGSHVAGTIGARGNDGFGVAGINWDAGLLPLRTLDSTGVGTSGDIAAAFAYAGELGVDVVNASLGGSGQSTAILQAINAYPKTLFVVAAGNDGTNNDLQPQYPCNYPAANLICVAASDADDNLAGFSNYGALAVDLAAPGVGIVSTAPAKSQPWSETFETDISTRWIKGGTNSLWTRAIDAQGGYLSDSLGLSYLNDTDSWIATASPFSLKDQSECKLHFTTRLDLENGNDALLVEMSRDAATWSKVGGWTGSSGGRWNSVSDDIHAFDGAGAAYLRFRMKTNSSVTGDGADLDDVRIRCLSDSYSGHEFMSASGTSMASPHVAGVAALLKAAAPEATVSELVTALLSSAETNVGLAGRVSSSGRLDAAAALEAVTGSALGGAGPEPLPTEPAPAPSPEPTETTSPEPEPTTAPPLIGPETHERSITLRLRAHGMSGRVELLGADAPEACRGGVIVKIKRNGQTLRTITTTDEGVYRLRLRYRPGRYRAVAPAFDVRDAIPTQTCAGARSPMKRR